jgi:hypothetical protein
MTPPETRVENDKVKNFPEKIFCSGHFPSIKWRSWQDECGRGRQGCRIASDGEKGKKA